MERYMLIFLVIIVLLILTFIVLSLHKKTESLTNVIDIQELKQMTPTQISKLSQNDLSYVYNKTIVINHGIPSFPTLQSQLSEDQFNAFYRVFYKPGIVF